MISSSRLSCSSSSDEAFSGFDGSADAAHITAHHGGHQSAAQIHAFFNLDVGRLCHRVRRFDDGRDVLQGLGLFDLRDDRHQAPGRLDELAELHDVVRPAHERQGQRVNAQLQREASVVLVLGGQRRSRDLHAREIHPLAILQDAAIHDRALDVGLGNGLHAQLEVAVECRVISAGRGAIILGLRVDGVAQLLDPGVLAHGEAERGALVLDDLALIEQGLPPDLADRLAVVLAKVGNGLKVRCQALR